MNQRRGRLERLINEAPRDGCTVDRIADMTATEPGTVRRIYRKVNPESLADTAESLAEGLLGTQSATGGSTLENR